MTGRRKLTSLGAWPVSWSLCSMAKQPGGLRLQPGVPKPATGGALSSVSPGSSGHATWKRSSGERWKSSRSSPAQLLLGPTTSRTSRGRNSCSHCLRCGLPFQRSLRACRSSSTRRCGWRASTEPRPREERPDPHCGNSAGACSCSVSSSLTPSAHWTRPRSGNCSVSKVKTRSALAGAAVEQDGAGGMEAAANIVVALALPFPRSAGQCSTGQGNVSHLPCQTSTRRVGTGPTMNEECCHGHAPYWQHRAMPSELTAAKTVVANCCWLLLFDCTIPATVWLLARTLTAPPRPAPRPCAILARRDTLFIHRGKSWVLSARAGPLSLWRAE